MAPPRETDVGVDMGGTKTAVGFVGQQGIQWTREAARPDLEAAAAMAVVAEQIRRLQPAVQQVGLGFPGRFDRDRVVTAPNLPHFVGTSPKQLLESALEQCGRADGRRAKVTVAVANDAEVAARAEARHLPGVDRVLYLTVSTGVGGALWEATPGGGRTRNLEPGLSLCPDPDHPGVRLEHLAGGASIESETGRSTRRLAELAGQGDRAAQARLDRAARAVGLAIGQLLAEHGAVDQVVVGGGIALGVEGFLDRVRETVRRTARRPTPSGLSAIEVQDAALGEERGILGALDLLAG